MKKSQRESWTLAKNGITVEAGKLIEFQFRHGQTRVARVELVRTIEAQPPYSEKQVIHAKIYGKLTQGDGRRTVWIQPEEVIRVLDAPPPAEKELTSLWSPRDLENPFRVESTLSNEAWRVIARWYPFSVRVLKVQESGEAIWQEQARTYTWNEAKEAMQTLAKLHHEKPQECWAVMKCELRGKEGREKPVLWYPGQSSVSMTLRQAGLIKST